MTITMTPQWKAAVQHVSDIAHAKLPQEWHSRLEMATAICLHGRIDFDAQGMCHVLSSDGKRWYEVHGACQCEAPTYHPGEAYWCKHRIARGLALKAQAMLTTPAEVVTEEARRTAEPSQAPDATTGLLAASTAMSVPTHHEAPASVNVRLVIDGREVQLTLRDTDEARLLTRLATVLKQYPAATTTAASQGEARKPCPVHHVAMKLNHGKDGKSWWSHKTADGWCTGKSR